APRKRGRNDGDDANPRNLREAAGSFILELLVRLLSLAPGLGHHAPETTGREHELERVLVLWERAVDALDLGRVELGLVEGGVRRGLDDPEDHALVLAGGQLVLREHVEGNDQRHDDRPYDIDGGPVLKRTR